MLRVIAPTLLTASSPPTRLTANCVVPPAWLLKRLLAPLRAPLSAKLPPAFKSALPLPSRSTARSSRSLALTVPEPRTVRPLPNWLALVSLSTAPLPALRTVAPLLLRLLPAAWLTVPAVLLRLRLAPEKVPDRAMLRPDCRLKAPSDPMPLRDRSRLALKLRSVASSTLAEDRRKSCAAPRPMVP